MSKCITALLLAGIAVLFSCVYPSGEDSGPDSWISITNNGPFLMTVGVEIDEDKKGDYHIQQVPVGETRRWDLYLVDSNSYDWGCTSLDTTTWSGVVKATYKHPSLSNGGLYQETYYIESGEEESVVLTDCPGWYY